MDVLLKKERERKTKAQPQSSFTPIPANTIYRSKIKPTVRADNAREEVNFGKLSKRKGFYGGI